MTETATTTLMKINPADHAVRLTTTLNRLRNAGACEGSYKRLVRALGGVSFDHDAPINLLAILEHNGAEDCLWALCATAENCETAARLMAAEFAEAVLPIFERELPGDDRPRLAIVATRAYALGQIDVTAWSAARDAAWSAARDAAWSAAGSAARSAAWDAAWSAAGSAQAEIIKRYLLP